MLVAPNAGSAGRRPGVMSRTVQGFTLIECVIAVGLMAVSLPVVILALSRAHDDAVTIGIEECSERIVPGRLVELRAERWAREGVVQRAWVYDRQGRCLGEIDESHCRQGVARWDHHVTGFLLVARRQEELAQRTDGLIALQLSLERPAAAPAEHRRVIRFQTLMRP